MFSHHDAFAIAKYRQQDFEADAAARRSVRGGQSGPRWWWRRKLAGRQPAASRRTITDFEVGVPEMSALESSGTKGFASGKYVATHPRAVE